MKSLDSAEAPRGRLATKGVIGKTTSVSFCHDVSVNAITISAARCEIVATSGAQKPLAENVADLIKEPQSFVSKYEIGERRLDILEQKGIFQGLEIGGNFLTGSTGRTR